MQDVAAWIRLQYIFGQGSIKVRRAASRYGSPRAFLENGVSDWACTGAMTAAERTRAKEFTDDDAQRIMDTCRRLGYSILTPDDKAYPERPRNIPNYAAALYISGDLGEIDDEVAVAVVGTRNISPYGKSAAHHLSLTLAKAGAVVVSGGAYGVDSYAHQGALMGQGRTIAVLGCGLDVNYPAGNADLRRLIAQNGALVSEYPPGTTGLPHHFPIRNRLMAGLCLGTVVIEADIRSGSLITAHHAVDQGRDVFAVPGDEESRYFAGCRHLIDEGAKPVNCAYDILEEYLTLYPHRLNLSAPGIYHGIPQDVSVPQAAERPFTLVRSSGRSDRVNESCRAAQPTAELKEPVMVPEHLSDMARILYDVLTQHPMHVDELAAKAGMPSFRAAGALTELELEGLARSHAGRRFSR
ncbi:MAG: DNA-protecting protein DprA [Clostridiales bacterium]|nr:DNA-protecting protein DprA [Clostridiales bacterium]